MCDAGINLHSKANIFHVGKKRVLSRAGCYIVFAYNEFLSFSMTEISARKYWCCLCLEKQMLMNLV